jgi:hypothetical protein
VQAVSRRAAIAAAVSRSLGHLLDGGDADRGWAGRGF